MDANAFLDLAAPLLASCGLRGAPQVEALRPDGSSRRFFRLRGLTRPVLAVLPPDNPAARDFAEARSMARIGRHLRERGAAVPEILGWDEAAGLVLCEDLGDARLHDAAPAEARRPPLYEATVRELARMQVLGADGFDPGWCWDTPRFDATLMRERESDYFLKACCADLLRLDFDREAVREECRRLAETAAEAPATFFLHRDCQSRNIMLPTEGGPVFIDFQGGRPGPLAYDLASLLIDPYAALPPALQDHLLDRYLEELNRLIPYDPVRFRREYDALAAQRNMQILGAFAFLSRVKGKPFFARFLAPAAASLAERLTRPTFAPYPGLAALSRLCHQRLSQP